VCQNADRSVATGNCATAGLTITTCPQTFSNAALSVSNTVSYSDNTNVYNGYLYQLWDAQKIQGCSCDLGYSGPDCASRVAPKGDDPLTTVKSNMMTQAVQIGKASGSPTYAGQEFFLVYHDPYGGVWRTDGIAATNNDATVAKRVQDALRALPNEVLEGVSVSARSAAIRTCHRFTDGKQHIPSANGHGTTNFCETSAASSLTPDDSMDFDIMFADKPGQTGVQFLFEVDITTRGSGSFPTSAGITESGAVYTIAEVQANGNTDLGNLSELAECSDRGLDNGDGECECFDGFRGLACEEQEALV